MIRFVGKIFNSINAGRSCYMQTERRLTRLHNGSKIDKEEEEKLRMFQKYVIKHYPSVQEKYPDYSLAEIKAHLKEMYQRDPDASIPTNDPTNEPPYKPPKKRIYKQKKAKKVKKPPERFTFSYAVKQLREETGHPGKRPKRSPEIFYNRIPQSLKKKWEELSEAERQGVKKWEDLSEAERQPYVKEWEQLHEDYNKQLAAWEKKMRQKGLPEIVDCKGCEPSPILVKLMRLKGWKVEGVDDIEDVPWWH